MCQSVPMDVATLNSVLSGKKEQMYELVNG